MFFLFLINFMILWFELFSQVSDVAHGPLVLSCFMQYKYQMISCKFKRHQKESYFPVVSIYGPSYVVSTRILHLQTFQTDSRHWTESVCIRRVFSMNAGRNTEKKIFVRIFECYSFNSILDYRKCVNLTSLHFNCFFSIQSWIKQHTKIDKFNLGFNESCLWVFSTRIWNVLTMRFSLKNLLHHLNKWDLMMFGPASLAFISFIKKWHKKLRLLVDLRIFSKFQGALLPQKSIWCSIYIPSFMKIGSVVLEELRWQGHLWVFSKFQGA